MLTSVIADLNLLGNPQIFRNPNGNQITISKNASGVIITISPLAYDITNTETINSTVNTALTSLGFTVIYNGTTIVISGGVFISNLVLTDYSFSIRDVADNEISTEQISLEILSPDFSNTQESCSYCLTFTNSSNNVTSQNPPIASRGKIDYYRNNEIIKSGNYSETISYCACEAATNISIIASLTIREIPNCGGTSPIVFQSLSESSVNIIEYKPSIQYQADIACCIPLGEEIVIIPVDITINNDTPHDECSNNGSLQYKLYNIEGEEIVILEDGLGTISTNVASSVITGTGTTFTSFPVGLRLYDEDGGLLGTVLSITNNTSLVLEDNSLLTYSGTYQKDQFFYLNPDIDSEFTYTPSALGSYTLTAILSNCCTTDIQTWDIAICKSYLVEVGACNDPVIKNISSLNYLKITLTTYEGLSLIDNITQNILFDETLVSPLSQLELGTLSDGFYKLFLEELNEDGEILSTEEQVLFYDCNIKACEKKLIQDILCFIQDGCDTKEYQDKNFELMEFYMYKNIIYSYWNDIKNQESIPSSWDIESHLQELSTYTQTINKLNKLCTNCIPEKKHCYSSLKTSRIHVNYNKDCGCNK